MKKDLIFAPILLVVGASLFLLQATGLTAHIIISIFGAAALVAYTVVCKKDWQIPALEIAMRACYGIALISGIVIMNLPGVLAFGVIHKVFATLFTVLLAAMLIYKLVITSRK